MHKKGSTVPESKGQRTEGRSGVAPKTASVGAGACDSGASSELASAAASLHSPKKGGAPGV